MKTMNQITEERRTSQFDITPILEGHDDRSFLTKLKVTWYFDTWFGKVLIALGLWSLIYSIARIIAQGWW